jgi:hypothetical protein
VANQTQKRKFKEVSTLTSMEVAFEAQDSQSPNYQSDWQQVGLKDKKVKMKNSGYMVQTVILNNRGQLPKQDRH